MSSLLVLVKLCGENYLLFVPFLSLNTSMPVFLCYFDTLLPFCKDFVFTSEDEQHLGSVWVVKYREKN